MLLKGYVNLHVRNPCYICFNCLILICFSSSPSCHPFGVFHWQFGKIILSFNRFVIKIKSVSFMTPSCLPHFQKTKTGRGFNGLPCGRFSCGKFANFRRNLPQGWVLSAFFVFLIILTPIILTLIVFSMIKSCHPFGVFSWQFIIFNHQLSNINYQLTIIKSFASANYQICNSIISSSMSS